MTNKIIIVILPPPATAKPLLPRQVVEVMVKLANPKECEYEKPAARTSRWPSENWGLLGRQHH